MKNFSMQNKSTLAV